MNSQAPHETLTIRGLKFCAAHRIQGHHGECKNLHGHNYSVEVSVEYLRQHRGVEGYLLDFGILKNAIKRHLDAVYDHSAILQASDPIANEFETRKAFYGLKLVIMMTTPTAENIAEQIHQYVNVYLHNNTSISVYKLSVTVFETDTCSATFTTTSIPLLKADADARRDRPEGGRINDEATKSGRIEG